MNKIKFDIEKLKTVGFYVLLFLLSAALAVKSKNYDFDMWARLIAGMAIVQTGQVLKYDFLSYTPTHPWYDHEWGSSVVFYLFQHYLGHIGLLLLQIILIFLTMLFLVKAIKVRCGDRYSHKNLLIIFIAVNSFMVTYASLVRCHSFSFLFFMFELYLLELIRKNNKFKLLFILPPLFLIWGNMHGGVVSGLGLLAMYSLGEILNKKPFKFYVITGFVCASMLFINPYGIEFVKFLIHATTMPRPDVVEWWWIFHKYNYHLFLTFKLMALFILILELWKVIRYGFSYKDIDKTKFIVMFVTLYLAIRHVKMMPFFALSAVAYCYEDIYLMFKNFKFPKWCMPALYVTLTVYAVLMLAFKDYRPMVNFRAYPIMEVEFIRANKITGNLLTNFGIGSYASYKLYPQNKIYMDGRYEEVYDDELMEDLNKYYTMEKGFDNIFKKNPPDVIILEKPYPMYKYLMSRDDWALVFDGMAFGVFIKAEKNRKDFNPPNGDLKYYKKTVFNTMVKFKGEGKVDINEVNKGPDKK